MLANKVVSWTAWCFALGATISYVYFSIPVPKDLSTTDQMLMRQLVFSHKLATIIAGIVTGAGYGNVYSARRTLQKMVSSWTRQDSLPVISETWIFDGVLVTVHRKNHGEGDGHLVPVFRPAIFFIPGGGWIYEYREYFAPMERFLVNELDVVLVSVRYRRAPEHPYPEPLNDCLTALKYLHKHSEEFGVNRNKITIAGDSAGGNLAAAVTLKLRDIGHAFLYRQILISPVMQMTSFRTRSYIDNEMYNDYIDTSAYLVYMNESVEHSKTFRTNSHISDEIRQHKAWTFLHKHHKEDHVDGHPNIAVTAVLANRVVDPYLCPLMADTLNGLPPALILASEFDVLRDDALAYADRLAADGTESVLSRSNGFHGIYCFFAQSEVGRGMLQTIIDYLATAHQS